MQQKQILRLAAVLALLLVIAYFTGAFESAPSTVNVPELSVDTSAIDRITVEQPGLSVSLQKESGSWRLVTPIAAPADSIVVAGLIKDISDASLESTVSSRPERYGHYGVDSTGTQLTLAGSSSNAVWTLSDKGPDFSSGYIRVDEDPNVYVATPRISLPTTLDRWRDKRIMSFSPRSVLEASVMTPEFSYTVTKGATGWTLKEKNTDSIADSAAVSRWLKTFSPLRGDGFFSGSDALTSTTHTFSVRLSDGSSAGLVLGPNGSDIAALPSGSTGTVYKLFSSRMTALFPDPKTLKQSVSN